MRPLALLLTLLTGFSGLVYEVTWQKCLATLLGSHSEATAAVLAIFLGGLAAGYSLFGRWTRVRTARAAAAGRPPRLLRLYGGVELAIGLHALAFPWLFRGAQALSLRLPWTDAPVGFGIDVALTALLIGPATVLMGGTIPILTQALSRSLADATRVHAHVYAFNTAGAFAGALAAGFVLIPWLGIEGVLRGMGVLNLLAGAAFLAMGARRDEAPGAAAEPADAAPRPATAPAAPGLGAFAVVALLLGFAMMATQTVVIRLGGLALGASHFTFSMVVAAFVLCIALGSLAVSALPRVPRHALPAVVWALAGCLLLLFGVADDAPYHAHWLRTRFGTAEADFLPFHLAAFAALLLVIGVPVALSGASLPLLFHHLRHRTGDLGAVAGRLYGWNTVGNLLGAVLGGYVLLLWLDLHAVYRVALAATALAALLLTARVSRVRPAWCAAVGAGVAVLLVALPPWAPHRLASGLFRVRTPLPQTARGPDALFGALPRDIEFYRDGPVASIAVKRSTYRGRPERAIITNGKSDSATGRDYTTTALIGLLPCLLAERCERAFVIGYGTGITAGELAELEGMREVTVAEISRGVIEAAPLFDFANRGASRSPKVEIVRTDAYRALLRSEDRYDVIVSEPSNPWVTGVEMLYSRELLEAARSRLAPGGVYGQWFHTYETDRATLELVLRTYLAVFEEVSLWFTAGPDLLLLGFQEGPAAGDLERLVRRAARPDYRTGLRRAGIGSLPELLAHEVLPRGVPAGLELSGPLHTLMHPRLSHVAARAFFEGGQARRPSAAVAGRHAGHPALLDRLLERDPGALADDATRRALVEAYCRRGGSDACGSAVAWWRSVAPDSAARDAFRRRVLPDEPEAAARAAATLDQLERFYGHGDADGGTLSPEEAQHAAALYRRHYLAPLPFRDGALDDLWARCRGAAGECAAAREAGRSEGRTDPS